VEASTASDAGRCEYPLIEQEALVLEMLGPNATLTIAGSRLTIADLEGRTLVYRATAEG
jgi:heat shock protein HslJ